MIKSLMIHPSRIHPVCCRMITQELAIIGNDGSSNDMSAAQQNSSVLLRLQGLHRLLVSYWQRSIDSGESLLGRALNFGFWLFAATPSYSRPAAAAMAVLEALKWQNFSQASEEATSTEGKAGVPRFDGGTARLSEYSFRVRMRQAREKSMAEDEVKKLGPLGLRLVDGLRGPALQVARTLPVDELAKDKGVEFLLKSLNQALAPRSKQEARELYQVGAQQGGILSRQRGESIASYVLRRRAWHNMMIDLDPELKLPETILSEQLLMNASISEDHKLLVRTAIKGEMTWDAVCEELVAQHSKLHEREAKGGFSGGGKGFKSAFKGHGKGGHPGKGKGWRSYHTTDEGDTDRWEVASQSLGGYEDVIEDMTAYHGDSAELYEDESDPVLAAFQAMVDEGLDENDMESAEYAAEILQAESEVYHARLRAQETGHYGFWGQHGQGRHFQVHGSLSLEEKKQRIQALKAKSTCRRCGQQGHWSDDAICPKGSKKGKGKSTSSTTSTASTKGGKSSKSKPSEKQRTVYFAINEYQESPNVDAYGYMVLKDNNGKTADELLDEMIAQAQLQTMVESRSRQGMLPNSGHLPRDPYREHAALVHAGAAPQPEVWGPSPERLRYLDLYMEMVNDPTDPEWQDANAERWNECIPGHPLFNQNDMDNLVRWRRKAQLGLPALPEARMTAIPEDEMDNDLFGATEMTEGQLRQRLGIDPNQTPGSLPTPTPSTPPQPCAHLRTTKQGSNDKQKVVKCKDCGATLMTEKLSPSEKMKTNSPQECQHEDKCYQGTTGTTWRWKCRLCGHMESGEKS